ncbi:MAG TPA: CHAT domain-containing protein [Pelomicrobium sp.]|nr:CHAT domain-containing protein [Pelomicrobium sp.]
MSLEDDVRQLVIDGERAAREARDPLRQKAALQPQYGLYLKILSRSQRPRADCAEDYLRVVAAMRDELVYAALDSAPDPGRPSPERIAGSPLLVLAAYLRRLPDTAVLVVESGANVLTLFALRGGCAPLEERIALERASKACVDALVELMRRQDEDLRRIGRRERITRTFFEPIERAAAALWESLPATIRSAIAGARCVLYLPSAFGDLSAFPLELLRAEDGWLGATRAVARLSSLRTLFELLSPGRMPSQLVAQALVVRAQDSPDLAKADAEAASVREQLQALGLAADVDPAPTVATVRAALDRGLRALHYCGHGFAGKLGEYLPLAATELLGPHDFSQLSGWGTPFVYLSTCEVGRARMTTTGSAAGVSTRLIEKGAPAVVGCLVSVPDLVAQAVAAGFYRAAAMHPLGEALAAARREAEAFPPACWGAFAYFGDPALQLMAVDGVVPQMRRRTLRWDSLVGRHLAVRSPASRQRMLDAFGAERAEGGGDADLLDRVAAWLATSFRAEEPELKETRLKLCLAVARDDAVAGCALRMLLAMETLHGSYYGARKPDLVLEPEELSIGLFCARAVHDTLSWPAFVIEAARSGGIGYAPATLLNMLDEATGMLDGWRLEEPAAATMLAAALELRAGLVREQRA